MQQKTYNIIEFANLMNVSVKTLRRLDRSGMLVADRVKNNQYQYTQKYINLFEEARLKYSEMRKTMCKSIPDDLVGQRFGKLVVIKHVEDRILPSGKSSSQWLCKCDCGNECLALGFSMKAGYKKSCGCLLSPSSKTKEMWDDFNSLSEEDAEKILSKQSHKSVGKAKNRPGGGPLQDLTGKQFGLWTVLHRGETRYYKNGGQAICWVCKCDCGTIKTVPGRDLKSGASQSCGCLSSTSWLEYYVKMYLLEHNFDFIQQKSYDDLRGISNALLYYDFLVLKDEKPFCLIECQGEQHFRPIKKFGGAKKLLKQQLYDQMKKDYAQNVLHIPLYEIFYTAMSKDDVYTELSKFL